VGILQLESRRLDRFNQERFEFLQLITGRIAAFLDNANLYLKTETQLVELKKLYDEVAYLVQLKTDMIRIASHDLRNPLGGISYYLQRLQADKDNLTEKQEDRLEKIAENVKKMNRITTDILSLEKIDQMAQEHKPEVFDLKAKIERIVNEQSDFAIRKSQHLTMNLPNDDVFIDGDESLLHEAITNLINNAIKYTPTDGNIEVKLRANERTGEAIVTVTDDGYGIPEDQQERLFSPFYRVNTRETSEIEGTGLGLHLVKNIINRHDGEMIFESVYGKGSRFGFNIPLLTSPPLA
jgi:two-component system phosphate regulon sensor histidine kinase PhoR